MVMTMCVLLLPFDYCVQFKVPCTRFSVKIALISYWNDFSLFMGKCASQMESYEKMQTKLQKQNQNFENFQSALYSTSVSMPLCTNILVSVGPPVQCYTESFMFPLDHTVSCDCNKVVSRCILVILQEMPFCFQLIFVLGVLFLS